MRNVVSSYRDDLQKDTVYIARKKCITGRTSTLVWIYGDSRGAFLTGVSLKPAKNFESYSSFHAPLEQLKPGLKGGEWVRISSTRWLEFAARIEGILGTSGDSNDILFPRHRVRLISGIKFAVGIRIICLLA